MGSKEQRFRALNNRFPDEADALLLEQTLINTQKYNAVIDELYSRQKEIHQILKSLNDPCIMTLYLICFHLELYLKSKMEINDLIDVLKGNGHNLTYLLEKSSTIADKERNVIKEHLSIINDVAPYLIDNQNYTHLRYNFLKTCLSDQSCTEIVLCDCGNNQESIEILRKKVFEHFIEGKK